MVEATFEYPFLEKSATRQKAEIRGYPIVGSLPALRRDPAGFLLKAAREVSPVVRFGLGPEKAILVADPDGIEHVLRTNQANYSKTKMADKLAPILGNGVAIANGEDWVRSRAAVQKSFTKKQVDGWVEEIDTAIQGFFEREISGSSIDNVNDLSGRLTLTVLMKAVFRIEDEEAVRAFTGRIEKLQHALSQMMWSVNPLAATRATKCGRDLYRYSADIREQVTHYAAQALAEDREGTVAKLNQFLGGQVDGDADLTDLVDQLITVFIAGHETTGNTLAWAFNLLARDPDLQKTLREEALMHLPLDGSATTQTARKLKQIESFVQEVMRLYPSAWWFVRTALEDDEVSGVPVKKGDVVIIAPYVTHRLEEYWPNPDRFDPERFLTQRPSHRFAFIPFGAGPRTCPGGHFAMAEMVLAVARLLVGHELAASTPEMPAYQALVTLRPADGEPLSVRDHSRAYWVKQCDLGGHELVDAAMRMRKRVFVDGLGWPVHTDEEGRERDQFDCDDANYLVVVSRGRIKSSGRALPACRPTLLYDVYGHIIDDEQHRSPSRTMWEGSRMATAPELSSQESRRWIWELVYQSARQAIREGVTEMVAASDPVLHRILRRVGANPQTLGDVVVDEHGFKVLAVSIDASFQTLTHMQDRAPAPPLKAQVLFGRRIDPAGQAPGTQDGKRAA